MKKGFNFEILEYIQTDDKKNCYEAHSFVVYRETSTDVLFVSNGGNFINMNDPQTGLPLTYKVWQEKYQNK